MKNNTIWKAIYSICKGYIYIYASTKDYELQLKELFYLFDPATDTIDCILHKINNIKVESNDDQYYDTYDSYDSYDQ